MVLTSAKQPFTTGKKTNPRIKQSYIEPKPFTNTADHFWDELLVPNSPLCTPHSQPWQDPSVFLVSSYRRLYSSWPGCLSLQSTLYCSSLCNYTPRSSATKSKESQQQKMKTKLRCGFTLWEDTFSDESNMVHGECSCAFSVESTFKMFSYKQEPFGGYRET